MPQAATFYSHYSAVFLRGTHQSQGLWVKVSNPKAVFWYYCLVNKVAGCCCRFFTVAGSPSATNLGINFHSSKLFHHFLCSFLCFGGLAIVFSQLRVRTVSHCQAFVSLSQVNTETCVLTIIFTNSPSKSIAFKIFTNIQGHRITACQNLLIHICSDGQKNKQALVLPHLWVRNTMTPN